MGERDGHQGDASDGDRRAELLGGAVADDLDAAERAELERLLARDPSAAAELEEMRAVLAALPPRGSGWDDAPAPPRERLDLHEGGELDRVSALGRTGRAAPARDRRPRWFLGAAAAALVLLGVGAGVGLDELAGRPPSGPPGTLGAVEQVAVVGEPPGVEADVAVVAHTWGTETVLDVDGLPVGGAYRVALLDEEGAEVGSGSFLGSELPVECRLNAALLREDVDRLVVLDAADDVVMSADLPAV